MIPLVATKKELDLIKASIDRIAGEVARSAGRAVPYLVGTMIELPRAALRAGEIAESAEFFSFGTNDLTQTTLGLSRDDAGSFLGAYQKAGIFEHDPFVTIDRDGVGELIRTRVRSAAARRAAISSSAFAANMAATPPRSASARKSGSITFPARRIRVPIARLAAAQAAMSKERVETTA